MSEPGEGAAYASRAVDRVCDILDALANTPGVSLSEVAETTNLPKSSAFRYLAVLEARHYVERDVDQSLYRLGPAFRPQNDNYLVRLVEAARPELERLRDKTGETTNLGVLDGTYVIHQLVCESPHMMRLAARTGERGYLHSTALGKALAASLPPERVRSILAAAGMPGLTVRTITTEAAFEAELQRVAERGFGLDEAENQDDGRCVGVMIPGLPILAGVSVSAPATRLAVEDVPAVARDLQRTAARISKSLGVPAKSISRSVSRARTSAGAA